MMNVFFNSDFKLSLENNESLSPSALFSADFISFMHIEFKDSNAKKYSKLRSLILQEARTKFGDRSISKLFLHVISNKWQQYYFIEDGRKLCCTTSELGL